MLILQLRRGVPPGDLHRGAAIAILTGFAGGDLATCLAAFVDTGIDADGHPRLTLRYRDLYDAAGTAGQSGPVPAAAATAVRLACSLVTGQPAPDLRTAESWPRPDAAVVLGGLSVLLGFTGSGPDAIIPALMEQVIAYEQTHARLRALCRPDGQYPGAAAALMREVDEPTGVGGRPVLSAVWAVLAADVEAILAGHDIPVDVDPEPEVVRRSTAVLDLHPTGGPGR